MRQDEQTQTLAQSFGSIAGDYDRLRPEAPDEALDWLLPPGASGVVELGAGTGILTRKLVARVKRVQAIEPDPRMREVLADRAQGADVVAGRAEELPAADSSVDAVIASSAWHWIDEEQAVPEVARVLRLGGFFSLLWCGPDRSVDWMRALWAGGQPLNEKEAAALDTRRRGRHQVDLGATGHLFTDPETKVMRWATPMTKDDLVGLAGTYSAVITMDEPKRRDYLNSMRRFLGSHVEFGSDVIEVPMRCLCWRTVRL